jgi:hypothetical protein
MIPSWQLPRDGRPATFLGRQVDLWRGRAGRPVLRCFDGGKNGVADLVVALLVLLGFRLLGLFTITRRCRFTAMETSLHRKLKELYAANPECIEVLESRYRIDALDRDGVIVEIQHSGLGAIRKKIRQLLDEDYYVRIIKPCLQSKLVATVDAETLSVIRQRKSPKKIRAIDIFRELIHFTQVYPHPQLTLELLFVDSIEIRIDTPRRGRRKQYKTLDVDLVRVPDPSEAIVLATLSDLWDLLGRPKLPKRFDTQQLAEAIGEPRWFAQQIAYVLKSCGATKVCDKRGNAIVYRAA